MYPHPLNFKQATQQLEQQLAVAGDMGYDTTIW